MCCVQENASKPPLTAKLEEGLLSGTKVEKVHTKTKGYEEALRGNPISSNEGLDTHVRKGNEPQNHKTHLGLKKSKLKEKKRVKEKAREKPDQKYEPPH